MATATAGRGERLLTATGHGVPPAAGSEQCPSSRRIVRHSLQLTVNVPVSVVVVLARSQAAYDSAVRVSLGVATPPSAVLVRLGEWLTPATAAEPTPVTAPHAVVSVPA